MTVLDNHRTYPELPHPRWRLPPVGDLLSYDVDAPSQSAVRFAARLGPIYELRALGVRYVVAAGAEFVTDLNDETRFCKHLGPEIAAMRIVGGDLVADPNYRLQIQERLTTMPKGFRLTPRLR